MEEQHGGRKAEDKGKTKTCPIRGVSDFIHGGKGGGGEANVSAAGCSFKRYSGAHLMRRPSSLLFPHGPAGDDAEPAMISAQIDSHGESQRQVCGQMVQQGERHAPDSGKVHLVGGSLSTGEKNPLGEVLYSDLN